MPQSKSSAADFSAVMQGPGLTVVFSALALAVLAGPGVEASTSNNVTSDGTPWTNRELEQQATISQLRVVVGQLQRMIAESDQKVCMPT